MRKKASRISRRPEVGGLRKMSGEQGAGDFSAVGDDSLREEKRRTTRFPTKVSCQVEDQECEIQDVSYAGLRFVSKVPLEPESTKYLTLPIQGDDGEKKVLRIRAHIRWCRETENGEYAIGAEVSIASREDEAEFLAFLFRSTTEAYLEKESELVELESYRALVELAADPILVLVEGDIAFSNQAAVEMFGHTSEELKGMNFDHFIVSGPHATTSVPSSLVPLGEQSDPYYFTLKKASGESVDVEIRSRSILYGHQTATLSILHDLTDRKKFENMLVQVERLKVLGELSAGIAHDVNNSLLGILAAVELIRPGADEALIDSALRTIKTSAMDGAATIRRVQGFSRLREEKNFVSLDINEIVSDAKTFTRHKWMAEAKANGLTINVSEFLAVNATVEGDPSEIRQAVINLVLNAVDAMPDGGEIELRTEVDEKFVSLRVTDSGAGVPAEIRDKLFDPFFSTKGERGSGLGLSTVYGIMVKHNGSVTVDSEEGRGTTIHLKFPRADEHEFESLESKFSKEGSSPTLHFY